MGTATVTGLKDSNVHNVVIPQYYKDANGDYYKVTSVKGLTDIGILSITISEGVETIEDNAFYISSGNSRLRSVILPSTIKSIGTYAFSKCSNLKTIVLPNSLETIGKYAFSASGIESIDIPASVTSINIAAFYKCNSLEFVTFGDGIGLSSISDVFGSSSIKEIIIPASITNIDYAFSDCSSLESITFENGSQLTTIGTNTFNNCSSLKEITIPASVTSIKSGAFTNCNSINKINFEKGSNLKTIESKAINNCPNLTLFAIPEGVTTINKEAISNTGIVSITLPSTLETIADSALVNNTNLTTININEGLTSLAYKMFEGCTSLRNVHIPASVTSISTATFMDLRDIQYTVDEANTNYSAKDGHLLSKDGTTLHAYYEGSSSEFVIPEGVTNIGEYAVSGTKHITDVVIPQGITISNYAFQNSESIISYTLEEGVTSVSGSYILKGCKNPITVNLPSTISSRSSYCLKGLASGSIINVPNSTVNGKINNDKYIDFSTTKVVVNN